MRACVCLALLARAALAEDPAVVPDPYIINGNDVPEGLAYPFVTLQTAHGDSFCGGTVVGRSWVLTAAHCAADAARVVYGALGAAELFRGGDGVSTHPVAQSRVHPAYRPQTLEHDVAVLHLGSPLPESVPVASLPAGAAEPPEGTPLYIVGFGVVTPGTSERPSTLQHAAVGYGACPARYALAYGYLCSEVRPAAASACSSFCAHGSDGWGRPVDACYGDSGGPAFRRLADGGFEAYGVTSWGVECGLGPAYPGVYTLVGRHAAWLREAVACEATVEGLDVYDADGGRMFAGDGRVDSYDFLAWRLIRTGVVRRPAGVCGLDADLSRFDEHL